MMPKQADKDFFVIINDCLLSFARPTGNNFSCKLDAITMFTYSIKPVKN